MIAAKVVTHSSGEGPQNGILAMGRRLSPDYYKQLSQQTKSNFTLELLQGKTSRTELAIKPIVLDEHGSTCLTTNSKTALAYRKLIDLNQINTAQISLEMSRDIYQQGVKAAKFSGLTLLGVGVILSLLLARLFNRNLHLEEMRGRLLESINDKTSAIRAYDKAEAERTALESRLRQKQKMEAIGTMAGGIAHDFNNILAIILGNAKLIQHKLSVESPCRKNLDNLLTATSRASDLIKQILTYSRQQKPRLLPSNLTSIINDTLSIHQPFIPPSIKIHKDLGNENRCVWINADATQLQQIFINLWTNAIHAMEDHGTLSLFLTKKSFKSGELAAPYQQKVGPFAELSISDTGKGMSPELIDKIFDPFFTTKGPAKGTGMGLSVVQGIVENHHGMITVESVEGEGSTFTLYLPICEPPNANQAEVEGPIPTGNERILFIDDEAMLVSAERERLENLGYRVTAEISGLRALDLFKKNPDQFDLIISDKTMPDLSGHDLAHEIRKVNTEIPIILCSGYYGGTCEKNIPNQEINAYCSKPLDMRSLSLTIRQLLGGKNSPTDQ